MQENKQISETKNMYKPNRNELTLVREHNETRRREKHQSRNKEKTVSAKKKEKYESVSDTLQN